MPSGFFQEADAIGIVKEHAQAVLELEDAQAKSIMSSYQDARRDLVDRLSSVPRGSFTAQHLRGVLAQVNSAIATINKKLAGDMYDGSFEAAKAGVGDVFSEINTFDDSFLGAVTPINLNAAVIAQDTANHLTTKYETNLAAYGNDLSTQIANGLFSASIGEANYSEVVGRISQFFNAEEWKLHRLVRTELHNIYNVGKLQGMRELIGSEEEPGDIPDLKKTLMHPMDQRTGADSKKLAAEHPAIPVDDEFVFVWKGIERRFLNPPDRPNDRAIMVPYRDAWGKVKGAAFVPGTFPA